jgi:hypothetical protein
MKKISHERLKALLHYDPETGIWTWIKSFYKIKAGTKAGTVRKDRYVIIAVDRKPYLSHRLAWFYMTGEWPPKDIDHKDTDPSNNAWNNLRLATRQENSANSKAKNTGNRPKGVTYIKRSGKWRAYIKVDYKFIHLGCFVTEDHAITAYRNAAEKYFGAFAKS